VTENFDADIDELLEDVCDVKSAFVSFAMLSLDKIATFEVRPEIVTVINDKRPEDLREFYADIILKCCDPGSSASFGELPFLLSARPLEDSYFDLDADSSSDLCPGSPQQSPPRSPTRSALKKPQVVKQVRFGREVSEHDGS
jgi:hypothetical protein